MLHDHRLTRHAEQRMRQRGMRPRDLDELLGCASQVAPDTYLLTDHDVDRESARLKHSIEQLERLRGTKLVVVDGHIVTVCYADHRDRKRVLRRGRAAGEPGARRARSRHREDASK